MIEVLCLLLGTGLLGYWALAITKGELRDAAEPWPGHSRHEACFLVPDVVMGLALILSVILPEQWSDVAHTIRLMASGGLVFLGLMDLAYLALTWRLRRPAMRTRTAVLGTIALFGGIVIAAFS